jgi:indolepyruvate ferredoxin oxidoreductase alpha subunit
VAGFVSKCKTILVLEEPDAAIELQIPDRHNILGRLDGTIPNAGELSPDVLYPILGRVLTEGGLISPVPFAPERALSKLLESARLPARPPRLCPGCAHRSAFYSIQRVFPGAFFTSDIGCYTLGTELGVVDTCLDMGAAITIATGMYHAYRLDGRNQPIVATMGDSTFIHSGVTGLVNAVHTGARFVLVILDNGTTAMTGFQPTAAQKQLADGSEGIGVAIPELVRACGVRFLQEVDPYQQDAFRIALKEAAAFTQSDEGGVAVVVAQRKCILRESPSDIRQVKVEIGEECDGCGCCLTEFGCPALVANAVNGRLAIDRRLCVDCGQCTSVCNKGMILESRTNSIV